MLENVHLTPLKRFELDSGDVLHGLKASEQSYAGFGEAYFSMIHKGQIKGWKKHLRMTMNLIVPIGSIKFVLFDDREGSSTNGNYMSVVISKDKYSRLTVPPGIWVAFQGVGKDNMLTNIASIEHDPEEAMTKAISEICYEW